MNNLMYLPFLLFIIAAYIYYMIREKRKVQFYRDKRAQYINKNSDLTEEQSQNLTQNLPWVGMESSILLDLFGEPRKKRILDQSLTRVIWSYADTFIYINDGFVVEWKNR